jgi:5-formyltetrahydrofolate cyclo-ligase
MDKRALRERFRGIRGGLPRSYVAQASAVLCENLSSWHVLLQAKRAAAYLAVNNEPDLRALFGALPTVSWLVPRVAGPEIAMYRYTPDHLVRGPFGIPEPAPGAPGAEPATIDIVLVPGIAFDQDGHRLGFGRGYYDRFLKTTPAIRVGIALDCLLARSVPATVFDERMDWVVTPTRRIECRVGQSRATVDKWAGRGTGKEPQSA